MFFVQLLFSASLGFALETQSSNSTSSISGYVKDKSNGETLIGATVQIISQKRGAVTNKSGFYSINKLSSGEYEVSISYVGFSDYKKTISIKRNEQLRLNVELEPSETISEKVVVTANRIEDKREISISKINVPIATIKDIKIGGESDVFRSLQMLPGILTSSQISSGLFVRGGSPDQNLVLLDGVTVYNPSHLFGFISTFNTDAIKDVELIKGGYPTQYGNRLSAVLNMTQKDGNRENFEGLASIGLISSRLSLQVPVLNGSFMISGRTTYLELVKSFLSEDPTNPIPDFNFYDINAKLSQDIGDDDKLYLSGFYSKDNFDFSNTGMNMGMYLSNKLVSARWNRIWNNDLFSNILFSYSQYNNDFNVDMSGLKEVFKNSIEDYTSKINFEWFISDNLTAIFGNELNYFKFKYLLKVGDNQADTNKTSTTGTSVNLAMEDLNEAIFSQWNWQATDLFSVQTGLRLYYWLLSDKFLIDPRIALRYQFGEYSFAKLSWGIFHQSLRLASLQDFSFFDTWLTTDKSVPVQKSIHYIASVESQIFDDYQVAFDVYYKDMYNVGILNQTTLALNEIKDVFEIGDAKSYGFEFFLQKQYGKLTGWFGYAFGIINAKFPNINNGKTFHPKYDRTHDLKLVMQYQISKSWDVGLNFVFQTGQSFTGATSRFISKMPGQNYGTGKIIPSDLYGLRMPESHQLNINTGYNHKFFGLDARTSIDIYNVYNRRDLWFRSYDTRALMTDESSVIDIRLLPIIPSISFEVKF